MTITDIFKSDFLTQATGDLTLLDIGLVLGLSFLLGLFIFFIYKHTFTGVMYSKTFNVALVMLAMISSTIIVGVTNNIVLSLGMLGALSIVRFRTAIKDPMDVVYMFWAITVGIITGAGLILLAVVSSAAVGIILIVFSKTRMRHAPSLLVITYGSDDAENAIFELLSSKAGSYKIKSKTKSPGSYELTVELRAKSGDNHIVNTLDKISGIKNVAMVSCDGEYAG